MPLSATGPGCLCEESIGFRLGICQEGTSVRDARHRVQEVLQGVPIVEDSRELHPVGLKFSRHRPRKDFARGCSVPGTRPPPSLIETYSVDGDSRRRL
jgi:hypothetical protein